MVLTRRTLAFGSLAALLTAAAADLGEDASKFGGVYLGCNGGYQSLWFFRTKMQEPRARYDGLGLLPSCTPPTGAMTFVRAPELLSPPRDDQR